MSIQTEPPKVSFHTLGCKLNYSETETLARQFGERQFLQVPFAQAADVCVINTCSVTDEADKKCRKAVRQALRANPAAFVIVVGCYAQLKPLEIAEIEGVDAVLGAAEKFRLFDLLPDFNKNLQTAVHRCSIDAATSFFPTWSQETRTRSFLKVQDGCDYKCSFCTIPLARGISRSESPDHVISQINQLHEAGTQEVVLTGINLGDYQGPAGESFADLLSRIDNETEVPRIRISSIEPNLLEDRIIETVATSNKLVPHFHIPLQSGSDRILAAMRRRYKRDLYADRVHKIKNLIPEACIGCDVIVGFPGETDADFEETHRFLADLPVDYLHVFTFSERDDTLAAEMSHIVPVAMRRHRNEILRGLSLRKKHAFDLFFAGTEHSILWEKADRSGQMHGLTENYIAVTSAFDPNRVNQIEKNRLQNYDSAAGLFNIETIWGTLV